MYGNSCGEGWYNVWNSIESKGLDFDSPEEARAWIKCNIPKSEQASAKIALFENYLIVVN